MQFDIKLNTVSKRTVVPYPNDNPDQANQLSQVKLSLFSEGPADKPPSSVLGIWTDGGRVNTIVILHICTADTKFGKWSDVVPLVSEPMAIPPRLIEAAGRMGNQVVLVIGLDYCIEVQRYDVDVRSLSISSPKAIQVAYDNVRWAAVDPASGRVLCIRQYNLYLAPSAQDTS